MTDRRPRTGGPAPRVPRDEAGFSLVEVVVALMVFSLVSLGLLHSVIASASASGDARHRVIAANLAASAVDQARAEGRIDLATLASTTSTTVVEGTTYTVERSATWVPGTGGTSCSSSTGSALLYKRIGVAVTWPRMGTTPPVRSDTVVSPPATALDPTRGNIAVVALSRDARAVGFAQVSLSGPSNVTALTDDQGCAFFGPVPTGTYTVQVTKLDHVDQLGAPAATGTVTAVAGQTVATQVSVDRAARLRLLGVQSPTGAAVDPVAYPLVSGASLTLGQTSLPQGRRTVPALLATDTVVFPYLAGYKLWLGACADANPDGVTTASPPARFWSTGAVAPVVATDPGTTTSTSVRGAQVELTVRSAGSPVVGATVQASHPADPGSGCASGETVTLGTTGPTGTVRATMPYGKGWTFTAGSTVLLTTDVDPTASYPRVVLP